MNLYYTNTHTTATMAAGGAPARRKANNKVSDHWDGTSGFPTTYYTRMR